MGRIFTHPQEDTARAEADLGVEREERFIARLATTRSEVDAIERQIVSQFRLPTRTVMDILDLPQRGASVTEQRLFAERCRLALLASAARDALQRIQNEEELVSRFIYVMDYPRNGGNGQSTTRSEHGDQDRAGRSGSGR